jgi:hypothetical protein
MSRDGRLRLRLSLGLFLAGLSAVAAQAQERTQERKPTDLPNPYKLVEGWPTLPPTMRGVSQPSPMNFAPSWIG